MNHLLRLAPLLCLTLAAWACGPGKGEQDPGRTGLLGPETVALAPGGTIAITLALDAEAQVTSAHLLSAQGLPSGVHATFAPDRLSAEARSTTLTLRADAGATRGTALVRVLATADATAAREMAFALTVRGQTIQGRVIAQGDAPRERTTARIGDAFTTVRPDGTFVLEDVVLPYELVLEQEETILIVPGLSTPTPTVATPWRPRSREQDGTFVGTLDAPVPAGQALLLCFDAPGATGCTRIYSGDDRYWLDSAWDGATHLEGTLRGLRVSSHTEAHALTGAVEVTATALDWSGGNGDVVQNLSVGAPPALRALPVTVTMPEEEAEWLTIQPLIRLTEEDAVLAGALAIRSRAALVETSLQLPATVPEAVVIASGTGSGTADYDFAAWAVAGESAAIAIPPAPVVQGPLPRARVDAATAFSVAVDGPAAFRHVFELADRREVWVQTASPSIHFPDVSALWPEVTSANVRSWSVGVAPGAGRFEQLLQGEVVFEIEAYRDWVRAAAVPTRDGQLFVFGPVALNVE